MKVSIEEVKEMNKEKETRNIFEGLSFNCPPVSKKEYVQPYEEYVKRCST